MDYVDEIVLDGFFTAIEGSLKYLLENTGDCRFLSPGCDGCFSLTKGRFLFCALPHAQELLSPSWLSAVPLHGLQQVLGEPPDRAGASIPHSLEQSVARGGDRDSCTLFAGINGQTQLRRHPKSVLGHQPSPTLPCTRHRGDTIFVCGESREPILLMRGVKEKPQSLSITPVRR